MVRAPWLGLADCLLSSKPKAESMRARPKDATKPDGLMTLPVSWRSDNEWWMLHTGHFPLLALECQEAIGLAKVDIKTKRVSVK